MYIRLFSPILRRVIAVAVALLCQGFAVAQDEPLPPGALARLGTLRFRHGGAIGNLAITADGRLLASAGWDGKIRLFDRVTGLQTRLLDGGPVVPSSCLAFSPDGKLLACSCQDGEGVQLWDVARGQKVRVLTAAASSECVAFSPNGKALASCDSSNVYLCDVSTGRLLQQWESRRQLRDSLHFSDDGRTLIAANEEGTIFFWDTASGKERRHWPRLGRLRLLALSGDGKTLAATEDIVVKKGKRIARHGVHLWDVASSRHLRYLDTGGDDNLTALAWSADGKALVVGDRQGMLAICDVSRGKLVQRVQAGSGVVALHPVPGSRMIVSGHQYGTIRLWDSGSGKEVEPSAGHQGFITSLVLSPDGRRLFSLDTEGAIRFWQTATGRQVCCRERRSVLSEENLALSSDGSILALASPTSGIQLYETTGGKTIRSLAMLNPPSGLAFSGAQKPVLAACAVVLGESTPLEGTEVHLWDARTGRHLRSKEYKEQRLEGIAFSPDGKTLLAVGYREGGVSLLDAASLKELRKLPVPPCQEFTLSRDGRRLAFISEERFLELWDVASGRRLFRLDKAGGRVHGPAFSPDGATLAAGDEQGWVRLWETATGRQRGCFKGHRGEALCLAFAPDGRTLASGGEDTTILLWDLTELTGSKRTPPAEDELQALWQDLAGRDASRAYRAVWMLAQFPELSVPFLRWRLRPSASYSPEHLSRLIGALGSDSFAVRQEASQELERAEMQAEPALRAALADEPDLEIRRRLELLLGKINERVRDPETLRAIRAIEALEHAGTAEARGVLENLAGGAEGARPTRQARAALERLSKRPTRKPRP